MPSITSATALALAALAALPAAAATPEADPRDQVMVVGRDVMPRIAYHALEPQANPVSVQATVFPGRVFHGVVDTLVGVLAADDELGERAPLLAPGPAARIEPGVMLPVADGPGMVAGGPAAAGRSGGVSLGGTILRATSGIGDRVGQTVLRVTAKGAGP